MSAKSKVARPLEARLSRRAALSALLASFSALALPGCGRPRPPGGVTEAPLWFSYGGKNREVLLSLVEQFHREQGAYRIHAVYQGDYFEGLAKLRTALAAGSAPALTHVVGEVVPYLAEAGVLEHLADFGDTSDLDLVPALAQEGTYVRGGEKALVALPFNRSTPIAYLNGDVLKQKGLSVPGTWDELRAFARAATERDASGAASRWGYECPIDFWFWTALVGQAGGAVVEDDGTATLGGEAGVRALSLWQSLVHEEKTMKPPPGRDYNAWQVANGDFLAGRAAMIWTSTAFLRYLEENAKFPVVAAPLPKDARASVPTGGTFFVMPRGAPRREQDAAFAFLRWMLAPEQANTWAMKTGYLPVSKEGLRRLEKSGYYTQRPNDRVAVDQLGAARPWPWSVDLFRIQREAVQPRLEEAILVPRDARAALYDARRTLAER